MLDLYMYRPIYKHTQYLKSIHYANNSKAMLIAYCMSMARLFALLQIIYWVI